MDSRRLCTAVAVSLFVTVPYPALARISRVEPRGVPAAVGQHAGQHAGQHVGQHGAERGARSEAGPPAGRGRAKPGTVIAGPAPSPVRPATARVRQPPGRPAVPVAFAAPPPQDPRDATGSEAGEPRPIPTTPAESSSIRPLQPSSPPQTSATARGGLRVEIGPASGQLYVDGFYVGTVEDSNRSAAGLSLPTGWHRLEVRAPGFVTPAINVTIEANRTVSYRGELTPLR